MLVMDTWSSTWSDASQESRGVNPDYKTLVVDFQVPTSEQIPHCCGGREVTCPKAAQRGPNREVLEMAQGQSLNTTTQKKRAL